MTSNGVDRNADRPVFRQIADHLREQILSGELGPGAPLPSESSLSERYGVAIGTVKSALKVLKDEGLILSERGRPWWVRPTSTIAAQRYALGKASYGPATDADSNFAREHGVPWSEFELTRAYRTVPAPGVVAHNLRIEPDALVCERLWTHAIQGKIIRLAWSYLEMARFADTIMTDPDEPPWKGGTIAQLTHLGYSIGKVVESVGIAYATEVEAELLGVPAGEALLEKWRTQMVGVEPDRAGVPVETARHVYPPRTARLVYEIGLNGSGRVDWYGVSYD